MLKCLKRYNGYLINESGNIIDFNGNLLRTSADNDGNLYVNIDGNIEQIQYLVAENFLQPSEKDDYKYIRHIDGDILNNHVTNIAWTNFVDDYYGIVNRENRKYSSSKCIYQVYNEDESDIIDCIGRGEVAKLIGYEEISLKNMIGNGRKIFLGPYKGYQIRNTHKVYKQDNEGV